MSQADFPSFTDEPKDKVPGTSDSGIIGAGFEPAEPIEGLGDLPADDAAITGDADQTDADKTDGDQADDAAAAAEKPKKEKKPRKNFLDVYAVMLLLSLVAVCVACGFLYMELTAYGVSNPFSPTPPEATLRAPRSPVIQPDAPPAGGASADDLTAPA